MTNHSANMSLEELEILENIDWTHRLWPRPEAYEDDPGEWSLTIAGTDEEDFIRAHNALIEAGFVVRDRDMMYVRRESPNG